MPELPEVQCFVNALNQKYRGQVVREITFRRKDLREPFDIPNLKAVFAKDARIAGFERVGKQIVIVTNRGKASVGLGMSGSFGEAKLDKPQKHEHVTLSFESGLALAYVDPRRFGFWRLGEPQGNVTNPLDPAALESLFCSEDTAATRRSVKDFLLDQARIGGVGNIYALEACHLAGIKPTRTCDKVLQMEWKALAKQLPKILLLAIERGGSTISTYRNLHGDNGGFQDLHRVYDREGERCSRRSCSGVIVRVVQGGRGSWFCPKCQK